MAAMVRLGVVVIVVVAEVVVVVVVVVLFPSLCILGDSTELVSVMEDV